MKKITVLLVLSIATHAWAQEIRTDSAFKILINERFIDRHLTLQKGRLQVGFSGALSALSKDWSKNSSILFNPDDVVKAKTNLINFNLKYGIFNWVEFNLSTGYTSAEFGLRTTAIYNINLQNYKVQGMNDLHTGLTFHYPFKTNKIDLAFMCNLFLPIASYTAPEPIISSYKSVSNDVSVFQRIEKPGMGIKEYEMGAKGKIRGDCFSSNRWIQKSQILLSYSYRFNNRIATNNEWIQRFDNSQYYFFSKEYLLKYPNYSTMVSCLHFQALSWLALGVNYSSIKFSNGWNLLDNKYITALDTHTQFLGVEVWTNVTTHLAISQNFAVRINPPTANRLEMCFQFALIYSGFLCKP